MLEPGVHVHVCMYAVKVHELEFLFSSHRCHRADIRCWLNINFCEVNISHREAHLDAACSGTYRFQEAAVICFG